MIKRLLTDFVELVQSDPTNKLPVDGTVHELTSITLIFLTAMFEYANVLIRYSMFMNKFEYLNVYFLYYY